MRLTLHRQHLVQLAFELQPAMIGPHYPSKMRPWVLPNPHLTVSAHPNWDSSWGLKANSIESESNTGSVPDQIAYTPLEDTFLHSEPSDIKG